MDLKSTYQKFTFVTTSIKKTMALKKLREAAQKTKDGKVDLRTKEGKEVAKLREERNEKRRERKANKK